VHERRIETADGAVLAGAEAGEGIPVVLLHGLTATRRYVVMGSRALERSGHRVVAYDARGHGASTPPDDGEAYGYDVLTTDLVAVLDGLGIERAVLAGASMGAHTILRAALDVPERVAGLVAITPAYDPVDHDDDGRLARWDRLSDGLREGGVESFVAAYGEHPDAVADALRAVPRARPFADLHALEAIECPAVVVASRDDADPGHPLAVGEAYARLLPDATLEVEDEGRSPLAWQGGQLSKVIAALAARAW
jgi:pimeloyl-ACP methyl ester carboxylesterase